MRKNLLTVFALMSLFAAAFAAAQQTGKALFDQARTQKESGDLQSATENFERVVETSAESDRNIAAKALLELGGIVESLGQKSRARVYYERVRSEFKDQQTEVGIATNRLGKPQGQPGTEASNRGGPSKVTIRTPFAQDVYSFAISPDGRMLVFQSTSPDGKAQLWRQAVDASAKPEPIAGTEGAGTASYPFFSPDGKFVAFFAKQKLWQVAVAGGTAKELADAKAPWGGDWRGGAILMSGRGSGGQIELLEDGRIKAVTAVSGLVEAPKFLDDRHFLYFSRDQRGGGMLEIGAIDGSKVSARGLPQSRAAAYSRGYLLNVNAGSLSAVPFDLKEMAASGTSTVLADPVGMEARFPGVAAFSVAADGTVAYRETAVVARQLLWMDRTGGLVGTAGSPDSASPSSPRLSPDGRSVLMFRQMGAPLGSAWVLDATTGAQRMFQDASVGAVWSPGGDRIVFSGLGIGDPPIIPALASRPVLGAATSLPSLIECLCHLREAGGLGGAGGGGGGGRGGRGGRGGALPAGGGGGGQGGAFAEDVGPNGHILFRRGDGSGAGSGGDLFTLAPNQRDPLPVAQSPAAERNGRFSPDGNWIAYQSDETGRNQIYVQPFSGTTAQRQRVSLNGGTLPNWGRNGGGTFFLSPDNHLMTTVAGTAPGGDKRTIEFGTPKTLFSAPLPPGSEYDVDRAHDRFLILAPIGDAPPIVVLSNWMPVR